MDTLESSSVHANTNASTSPCNLVQNFSESYPRIAGGSMVYECMVCMTMND